MDLYTFFKYIFLVFVLALFEINVNAESYKRVYRFKSQIPKKNPQQLFRAQRNVDGTLNIFLAKNIPGTDRVKWIQVDPSSVPIPILKQIKERIRNTDERIRPIRTPNRSIRTISIQKSTPIHNNKLYTWNELESSNDSSNDSSFNDESIESKENSFDQSEVDDILSTLKELPSSKSQIRYIPDDFETHTRRIKTHIQYPKEIINVSNKKINPVVNQEINVSDVLENQINPLKIRPRVKFSHIISRDTNHPSDIGYQLPSKVYSQSKELVHNSENRGNTNINFSSYELIRMQWKLFSALFNPNMDNVRIIKRVPPLGFKLSKNVNDCNTNFMKAFELGSLSVSGILYSKKIKRSIMNSINKELKEWCRGMMTHWYHQLEKFGIVVPKPKMLNKYY